jgi:L-alanine-DL-glutamate epimerase-like enolase superfamily enzyme
VTTKWSVSGVEPQKAAEIARWAIGQGFKAMKVKVGIDPDSDFGRLEAVRNTIGSGIKLGVDANGGWSTAVAFDVIQRLKTLGIYFVEQPVPPEEIAFMATLRKQIGIPLVADESIYTLQDAMVLNQLQAADVFSIYIGKAGGIGPAKAIADFGQKNGIKCTIGSNLELGVGSAAMVHLGMACGGITAEDFPCDIIGPFYYEDDVVCEPLPIKPGQAHAIESPGLGVELDEAKIQKYQVHQ